MQGFRSKTQFNSLLLLGHILCLTYIVFAAIFYVERAIYIDTGNQILEMTNDGTFSIFVKRYSMALHQVLPLLAIKAGLNLSSVIFLYSISFPLLVYAAFLISYRKFENYTAAFLFFFTLSAAAQTFFHAISETMQVILFSAFLYGWLEYMAAQKFQLNRWVQFPVTTALILLVFFMHPVSVFFIGFVLVYFALDHELYRHPLPYFGMAVLLVLLAAKLLTTGESSHDAGFFEELKGINEILPNITSSYSFNFLIGRFFSFYLISFLALLTYSFFAVYKKSYFKLLLTWACVFAYLLVSLVIYHEGDADHGMERSFLPLAFFCGLPFLHEVVFQSRAGRKVAVPLLAAISFWGFYEIYLQSEIFTQRFDELRGLLSVADRKEGDKFYLDGEDYNVNALIVPYGIAFETLLLSSLDGPEESKTIFINQNTVEFEEIKNEVDLFLFTNFLIRRSDKELNSEYYGLSGNYRELLGERILVDSLFCGAERVDEADNLLSSKGTLFSYTAPRATDPVYQGEYAVYTGPDREFAFTGKVLTAETGDLISIEIFKYGASDAGLVLADGDNYYVRQTSGTPENNGWERLKISFVVNGSINLETLKLYVWNPSGEPAYFDNLSIKKLSSKLR